MNEPSPAIFAENFERFRLFVLARPELQIAIREVTDMNQFIERTIELGREHGFAFTSAEIRLAMTTAQRKWLERWI